jgi:hypothetical protein
VNDNVVNAHGQLVELLFPWTTASQHSDPQAKAKAKAVTAAAAPPAAVPAAAKGKSPAAAPAAAPAPAPPAAAAAAAAAPKADTDQVRPVFNKPKESRPKEEAAKTELKVMEKDPVKDKRPPAQTKKIESAAALLQQSARGRLSAAAAATAADPVAGTEPNYYEVLSVKSDATPEAIEAAFRSLMSNIENNLAMRFFSSPTVEELKRHQNVKLAYGVLSHPGMRAEYDKEVS